MTAPEAHEFFVWTLFQQLRRRGFALGPDEYGLLRDALRAGFGWASRKELRHVCVALWAKSPEERAVVAALFDQHVVTDWTISSVRGETQPGLPDGSGSVTTAAAVEGELSAVEGIETVHSTVEQVDEEAVVPATAPTGRLPPLKLGEMPPLSYKHVFLPQYPVNFRTVAQTWRRLRWPVREGPAIELDVEATVHRRSRSGMVTPPTLRPRRRNRAKLLLLVDRRGSMVPFHAYVEQVCETMSQAGRLRQLAIFYFHDTPLEGSDPSLLDGLSGGLSARLDSILAEIPPLVEGELYADKELTTPVPAQPVLAEYAQDAAVVIVSDAGAARGRYDLVRLLDVVAFAKALRDFTQRIVWLNPLPPDAWARSTAAEIARHLPMFAMDPEGMHRAVNVLRGQPFNVEQPLPASGGTPQVSNMARLTHEENEALRMARLAAAAAALGAGNLAVSPSGSTLNTEISSGGKAG